MPNILKRTALYYEHLHAGARMFFFSGWEVPLYYRGIVPEHEAVRGAAGLFDLSHMGRIEVSGPRAAASLERLLSTRVDDLFTGSARYTLLLNHHGGVVDDLVLLRKAEDEFLLVVNASQSRSDLQWISGHALPDTRVRDVTEAGALLALQGPQAKAVLGEVSDVPLTDLGRFRFTEARVGSVRALISRTGYTGEAGFEILVQPQDARGVWRSILLAGAGKVLAAGLGARDTLRLEMGYCLYGAELTEEITPWEAGLGKLVRLDKKDFIGKEAMARLAEATPVRKLVGLVLEAGIPRSGCRILSGAQEVGIVTSGGYSPVLRKGIGLAYVATEFAVPGAELTVEVRGKELPAEVRERPVLRRE